MNNFYVYTYSEPANPEPFYIGKGSGNRVFEHLETWCLHRYQTRFYNKLNNLLIRGIQPIIQFVKENLTEQEAFDLEIILISKYGRLDLSTGCLCNHSSGGEGTSGHLNGFGHEVSFETKVRMSEIARGRPKEYWDKVKQVRIKTQGRRVCSVNILTGQIVRIFDSLSSVKEKGFSPSHVHGVLSGKCRQHGGYFWRDYQGDNNG